MGLRTRANILHSRQGLRNRWLAAAPATNWARIKVRISFPPSNLIGVELRPKVNSFFRGEIIVLSNGPRVYTTVAIRDEDGPSLRKRAVYLAESKTTGKEEDSDTGADFPIICRNLGVAGVPSAVRRLRSTP